MNRTIVYPGQIVVENNINIPQRDIMIVIGQLAQSIIGTNTIVDGLNCYATSPNSLNVNIGPGTMFSLQPVDSTPFSSLPADTTHNIVKLGINLDSQSFTIAPPSVSGTSQNILVQASFSETDTGSTVLQYFNASSPTQAYSGPSNNGVAQATYRQQTISILLTYGASATTGTQTTPAVADGYVPIYVITVPAGATSITNSMISSAVGAPFIRNKLPQSAPINSPIFTGNPSAPTPANGDSSQSIATTAFVQNIITNSISSVQGEIIGVVKDFAGSTAPAKYLLCYGQQVSRIIYANLFSVIGTTFGIGDGSTTFNIPDLRGRTSFGPDAMGGTYANRITSSVSGITPTLGATGGDQNPSPHILNATTTVSSIDSGHAHSYVNSAGNGVTGAFITGFEFPINTLPTTSTTNVSYANITSTASTTVSDSSVGVGGNIPPAIILNKIIYAGV